MAVCVCVCVCVCVAERVRTGGSVPSPTHACTAVATAAASAADSCSCCGLRGGVDAAALLRPTPPLAAPSSCVPESVARKRSCARSAPSSAPSAPPPPAESSAALSAAAAAASADKSRSPARKAAMRRCRRRCSRDGSKRDASRRMVYCGQHVRSMFGCAPRARQQAEPFVAHASASLRAVRWQQRVVWCDAAAHARAHLVQPAAGAAPAAVHQLCEAQRSAAHTDDTKR
jgi:hypothetical protein